MARGCQACPRGAATADCRQGVSFGLPLTVQFNPPGSMTGVRHNGCVRCRGGETEGLAIERARALQLSEDPKGVPPAQG
jgi:hypothetical protein